MITYSERLVTNFCPRPIRNEGPIDSLHLDHKMGEVDKIRGYTRDRQREKIEHGQQEMLKVINEMSTLLTENFNDTKWIRRELDRGR